MSLGGLALLLALAGCGPSLEPPETPAADVGAPPPWEMLLPLAGSATSPAAMPDVPTELAGAREVLGRILRQHAASLPDGPDDPLLEHWAELMGLEPRPDSPDAWARQGVAAMAEGSEFLFVHMAHDAAWTDRGQGLLGYSCGGTHLVMGAALAVARGYGGPEARAAVGAQGPLLLYRARVELAANDQALIKLPEQRLPLAVERLELTGHLLEAVHTLAALGLFEPDEEQQRALTRLAAEVVAAVAVLNKSGVLDQLDLVRAEDEALYLDLLGDAQCAARAMDLATGRAAVAY